jgi:RHS repeat-associated protein
MRHQLTSISFPDGTTSTYRYDPLGRRIESNAAGVVTRDVYDGQNVRLRYDGSNTLTASFVDAGVDGHLEEIQAGQRLFYLQDGSNSTVQLTNTAGATVASYAYDSFGNPAASNSASPANPFTYTGREFDPKSGLYYYRSRYYAADQGRFISEDPIGHLNAYTYTQNDPVDFADPSGALAVEYQALTISQQRAKFASCISSVVGAVAGVAAAGVSAAFDQPGAAASEASNALVAGAVNTGVSCALAAIPGGAAEKRGLGVAAGKRGLGFAEQSGILRAASAGKGNFGLGAATQADANILGRAWVGGGYRVASMERPSSPRTE